MDLYLAPINFFGNYVYRSIAIKSGADFVFSELIMAKHLEGEIKNDKFKIINDNQEKTIFQIGANTKEDLKILIEKIIKQQPLTKEINLNCGCPHSSFQQTRICSGLLLNTDFFDKILKLFSEECLKHNIIPSIKIRIGPKAKVFALDKYLELAQKNNIKKVYIHGRTVGHPYQKEAELDYIKNFNYNKYNVKIILNGDIDSYPKYKEIIEHENIKKQKNIVGIMIGRAALINPLIFHQIKSKIKPHKYIKIFSPDVHDPSINVNGQVQTLSKEKEQIIKDFIVLAKKNNLRKELVLGNLKYLTKGISNRKSILKELVE